MHNVVDILPKITDIKPITATPATAEPFAPAAPQQAAVGAPIDADEPYQNISTIASHTLINKFSAYQQTLFAGFLNTTF